MAEQPQPETSKELPYQDVNIERQIEILKAFAALGATKERATYKDIAPIVGLHSTKVSACLKFWKSVGLLEEQDGGYKASTPTVNFAKKVELGKEDEGWSIIGEHLKEAWFSQHLSITLRVRRSLSEKELLDSLHEASGVAREDQDVLRSLKILLRLIELSKIIVKDQEGKYMLNPEFSGSGVRKPIEVPEDEDIVKISIGKDDYVINVQELKEFVIAHGKKLAREEIRLE
ncbi:MAG: hypothetical protein QXX17_03225 [Conexivisphaerales archaeon]